MQFRRQTPAAHCLIFSVKSDIVGRDEFQRVGSRLEVSDRRPTALHAVVVRRVRHDIPHRFVVHAPVFLEQCGEDVVAVP